MFKICFSSLNYFHIYFKKNFNNFEKWLRIQKKTRHKIIFSLSITSLHGQNYFKIHWCPKLKLQPLLSFSFFVQNSSIDECKNMKLRENICFEIINWILHYWGFGNNLQLNTIDFFLKNYVLKKVKILMFLGKEIKWKVVIIMHYCQTGIGIPPKNT